MEDEEGIDHKVVCVPVKKVDHEKGTWTSLSDIPEARKLAVRHFFEHYKDLEPEKWVKLKEWKDASTAEKLIEKATKRAVK
jgi:inorganic pyrophosphatase